MKTLERWCVILLGARKKVKNLSQLFKYLQEEIDESLNSDVLNEIRDAEIYFINQDVLNSYSPKVYKRRLKNGIDSPKNIINVSSETGKLIVRNVTEFNPAYDSQNRGEGLAGLLEYGEGWGGFYYDFSSPKFNKPKRFISDTKAAINIGKLHVLSLRSGMKKRGFKIKTG